MARPHKDTVAYFPHDTDASDGKTLTIIQSKYGNDGYAFWFKLLQLLGKTPGHYFDFNKPADWEFLLAKTHQNDTETGKDILETLVVLGAIDAELYAHGIIWCQKFVDRVADAYNRTVNGAPQRPSFLVKESLRQIAEKVGCSESYLSQITTGKRPPSKKLLKKCLSLGIDIPGVNVEIQRVSVGNKDISASRNSKNITEIPQTKLNKTKLNKESKERKAKTLSQRFGVFWKAYPKRKSKGQAEKVFAKVNPDEQLLATMLATIERAKKSSDWQKDEGKFIPYPATWLNAKGWEDEFPEKGGQDGAHQQDTSGRGRFGGFKAIESGQD